MSRLRKTAAITALMILGPILAACAQQNPPDTHPASMGGGATMGDGGMMNNGGMMGGGMMGMQGGAGGQMQDMNKMMTQMSQMMDRCNAMMKDHKMDSSGHGGDSHQ